MPTVIFMPRPVVALVADPSTQTSEGRTIRGDQGHLVRGEHIASQSEVIWAIVSGHSPCCGAPAPMVSPALAPWKVISMSAEAALPPAVPATTCGLFATEHVLACSCSRDYPWGLQL